MSIDLDEMYCRYEPMVLRRCRSLLQHEADAVDAMHDTFFRIVRNHRALEDRGLASLLYRISTNICIDRMRVAQRRPEDVDVDIVQRIAALEEPESRLLARLSITRLFAGASASTRTMAVLHYHDGFTLEEVATITGLSVSGVRKRLKKLKQRLQRQGGC